MSEQYCTNCGAGLVAGARFCRHCGQPLPDSQMTSVTEGTTAVFPPPADYPEAPTRHFSHPTERPATGPAFMNQFDEPSPLVPPAGTHGLTTRKKRGGKVLLIGSVLIIFLAFVSLAVLGGLLRNLNRPPHPPRLPSRPSVPPPPVDGRLDGAAPLSELIYPGAKTEIDIQNNHDGHVLQLKTNDPFAKVVEWYETKMDPEERVIMPDQQAVLKNDEYQVIITPAGQETKILLRQGD